MIRSNLPQVKLDRERSRGHKITYAMMQDGAGVAASTIARLMSLEPVTGIDGKTLDGLCSYFECTVGELLEYVKSTE